MPDCEWYIEQINQRGNIDDVCQMLATSVVCIVSIHQERILGAAHDTYGAHITGASLALKVLRMFPGRPPQLLLLGSVVARALNCQMHLMQKRQRNHEIISVQECRTVNSNIEYYLLNFFMILIAIGHRAWSGKRGCKTLLIPPSVQKRKISPTHKKKQLCRSQKPKRAALGEMMADYEC